MVIKSVNLETVCGITSTIPENEHYEVAFAGKSNVGKSSLINTLMNRKALARTSAQPGKTQTINFYNINDVMYLVDLPGYGYAKASEEIKAKWGRMIENYLHTSQKLQAVFLLIDIRHDPSENDRLMYEWMVEQGFHPIIIATKADKISRGKLANHIRAIEEGLEVEPETIIIPFSAETRQGKEEIWELIDSLVLPEEDHEDVDDEVGVEKISSTDKVHEENISGGVETKQKKARWKSSDKATAKKTAKKLAKKKASHVEAAQREKHKRHKERYEEQRRQEEKKNKKQNNKKQKRDRK